MLQTGQTGVEAASAQIHIAFGHDAPLCHQSMREVLPDESEYVSNLRHVLRLKYDATRRLRSPKGASYLLFHSAK